MEEKATNFKSQDVIFEEETTHIAIQHRLLVFSENNSLFRYKQDNISMASELVENSNYDSSKIAIFSQQDIAVIFQVYSFRKHISIVYFLPTIKAHLLQQRYSYSTQSSMTELSLSVFQHWNLCSE